MKILAALLIPFTVSAVSTIRVSRVHVPNAGIQPQIVERDGIVHMVYFTGDPAKGDLFYIRSKDYGATFSKPIPVGGSAMALGNIRGAQMALGRNGRVHIAWNGAEPAGRIPMLYTRLNDAGTAFEPQRNVIQKAWGLNGGGSIAADPEGNVYVFWHAPIPGEKDEQNRRVWVARSTDDGKTFAPETIAFDKPIGVCGCCGMKAYADKSGVHVLFRSADQIVNRDMWLLTSTDRGKTFTGAIASRWNIGACVMSLADLAPSPDGLLAAWETEKQTYFGRVENGTVPKPIAAPGEPHNRKYPVVASNAKGETLFAWSEGTSWKKGGTVAWQIYDRNGKPTADKGAAEDFPVWGLLAAFTKPDGTFVIVW